MFAFVMVPGLVTQLRAKQKQKTGLQSAVDKAEKCNTKRSPALDRGWIFPRYIWYKPSLARPAFPCSSVGKEFACGAGDPGSIPGLERSPGEGNGNPLQHYCQSHGQRSLVAYSPWGRKESDTTKRLDLTSLHLCTMKSGIYPRNIQLV